MAVKNGLEVIGSLTVHNESGEIYTVEIRREDLTTTNGAYRAVRDQIAETLGRVLRDNRA